MLTIGKNISRSVNLVIYFNLHYHLVSSAVLMTVTLRNPSANFLPFYNAIDVLWSFAAPCKLCPAQLGAQGP